MNTEDYKHLISTAPFGYSYHRVIVDDAGKPVDYEFLEVNPAFEKLTGLKSGDILNRNVKEVIPRISEDKFDWIGFYGEIALNGGDKEFEQYSEVLKRWFKVQVYSPRKYYFSTIFIDITKEKIKVQFWKVFFR